MVTVPGAQHTISADHGSFRSDLSPAGARPHVLTIVGSYSYRCCIHLNMTGTVIVTG
jgi:plastocyanin